jgi:chromosomal replication initiation ATPase DnaA
VVQEIRRIPVETIIGVVSEIMNSSEQIVRARDRHGNDARDVSVYLAQTYSDVTNIKIGKEFGEISGVHVTYILKKAKIRLCHDQDFYTMLEKVEEILSLKG